MKDEEKTRAQLIEELVELRRRNATLEAAQSEHKQAQDALWESEEKHRLLVTNIPAVVWRGDREGKTIFISANIEEVSGYTPKEIYQADGGLWLGRIHPDDIGKARETYERFFTSNEKVDVEYRIQRKDERWIWLYDRAVAHYEKDGEMYAVGVFSDITERKLAEEALRKSEARYREIAENIPGVVYQFLLRKDGSMSFPFISAGAYELYGLRPEEIEADASTAFNPIDPKELGEFNESIIESARTLRRWTKEYRIKHENGGIRWVRATSSPHLLTNGDILWDGVILDITERKQAEEALRESEERYASIFHNALDAIFVVGVRQDGSFVYEDFNPAQEAATGLVFIDTRGKTPAECLSADVAAYVTAKYQACVEADTAMVYEEELELPIGKKYSQVVLVPIRDSAGRIYRLAGMARDLTERKQAEDALRQQAQIIDQIHDSVISADLEGYVRSWNKGAERLLGYSAEEVLGNHVSFIYPQQEHDFLQSRVITPLQEKENHEVEVRMYKKSGEDFYAHLSLSLLRDSMGTAIGMIGYSMDITERKRLEEMLQENEKLAATGRMAAGVAHEINNPLAGIKNSFYLIKGAVPEDHPYYKYVGIIDKEIDRIARIVRQMYGLYRPEQEVAREFRVDEALEEVVALLDSQCRQQEVSLKVDKPKDPLTAHLPEGPLRQVLLNVIKNAIEASPQGSVVTITVTTPEDRLNIAIADQGEGIPEAIHTRIFEPFFTTKSEQPKLTAGMGLGLSLSRSLVQAMGGKLDFDSQEGQGTTFQIVLPRHEQPQEVQDD